MLLILLIGQKKLQSIRYKRRKVYIYKKKSHWIKIYSRGKEINTPTNRQKITLKKVIGTKESEIKFTFK